MSLTIPPVQSANAQVQQTQQAPPPPKPAPPQSAVPQDKVTLSSTPKPATTPAGGDSDHDGH